MKQATLSIFRFASLSLLLLSSTLGCDSSRGGNPSFDQDKISAQIGDLINGVIKGSDAPLEELQKLHQFEYQIVRLSVDSSPKAMEGALDQLGKQRWDCFHVEKQTLLDSEQKKRRVFTFFCKRKGETPLRYVPRSILGR